jgi:hypothetical protein
VGEICEIPAENYSQPMVEDTRQPLPLVGDEREILTAFDDPDQDFDRSTATRWRPWRSGGRSATGPGSGSMARPATRAHPPAWKVPVSR